MATILKNVQQNDFYGLKYAGYDLTPNIFI